MKKHTETQETEIPWLEEVPEHWREMKLKYASQVNPNKGMLGYDGESQALVTFLPMESVQPDGSIDTSTQKPISELWTGYTYFAENDVIVAKITPCFENGKGAHLRNYLKTVR